MEFDRLRHYQERRVFIEDFEPPTFHVSTFRFRPLHTHEGNVRGGLRLHTRVAPRPCPCGAFELFRYGLGSAPPGSVNCFGLRSILTYWARVYAHGSREFCADSFPRKLSMEA